MWDSFFALVVVVLLRFRFLVGGGAVSVSVGAVVVVVEGGFCIGCCWCCVFTGAIVRSRYERLEKSRGGFVCVFANAMRGAVRLCDAQDRAKSFGGVN